MIDKNKLIEVKNRDNGRVGYTIPDLGNLHRTFQPQETKEIPFEELKKLSYHSITFIYATLIFYFFSSIIRMLLTIL